MYYVFQMSGFWSQSQINCHTLHIEQISYIIHLFLKQKPEVGNYNFGCVEIYVLYALKPEAVSDNHHYLSLILSLYLMTVTVQCMKFPMSDCYFTSVH